MIFRGLENTREEKRTSLRVGSSDFISLNPLNTFLSSPSISDVLMKEYHSSRSVKSSVKSVGSSVKSVDPYARSVDPSAGSVKPYAGSVEASVQSVDQYAKSVETSARSVEASAQSVDPSAENIGNRIVNYVYNHTDHLGNIRLSYTKDPVNNQLKIMEQNHYYPFGLKHQVYAASKMDFELVEGMEELARPTFVNKTDYQYKYNGKEFQDELGLGWYDYQARNYDPALGRWMNIDPLAEIARKWSPYTYAVNNPVYYIDPDGMKIDPGSQKEWDSQRKSIEDRRNELQSKVDGYNAEAAEKGWSAEKLSRKIGDLGDRISSLDGTLSTMDILADATNSQVYEVQSVSGDKGGVTMDTTTGNIVIGFLGNTENFIHETTHAGQFETGEIAFSDKGNVLGQDLFDETSAYKAEAGYSGSVGGLSINNINNNSITTFRDDAGNKVYGVGGSSRSGLDKIGINSTVSHLIKAYPTAAEGLKQFDKNAKLRDLPGVVTKK